ncbi:uncharacterized protein LOC128667553 [Microplitis demolitor]|uniref:uncharacterized protein LOC128667553 n=1 Tax=Microplitis demolitor TaxID=69319 RepID=UPI00235B62B4|nr:uncharacterized protein LOC128667553 [Microplitis demolitor]
MAELTVIAAILGESKPRSRKNADAKFPELNFLPSGYLELYPQEVQSLSELPMEQLLKIKNNFIETEEDDEEVEEEEEGEGLQGRTLPIKLPLKKIGNKSLRRHGDWWEEKGEDTKISKIFQFTLTTLSFLAFGGYLLTLVITSLKKNQASQGNVIVLSNLQKYTRPKRHIFTIDPAENEYDTDRLYRGMIMLSREYASYNKWK